MKNCPSCNTKNIHLRGHGNHIIKCKKCTTVFCFLCSFIFKNKQRRCSYPTINKKIKYEYNHYNNSNCSLICNEKCNCTNCFLCSLECCMKNPIHCRDCLFVKECYSNNDYIAKLKMNYFLI